MVSPQKFRGYTDKTTGSLSQMLIFACTRFDFRSAFARFNYSNVCLSHWDPVTHKCVCDLTTIGSDNGLPPDRRQAIIWTNAGILLIGPLGTNFSEILSEIHTFSFKKMHLKMSSVKWQWFCLGLSVLIHAACFSYQNTRLTVYHSLTAL